MLGIEVIIMMIIEEEEEEVDIEDEAGAGVSRLVEAGVILGIGRGGRWRACNEGRRNESCLRLES